MPPEALTVEISVRAEFYDVDSMKIVWHGNYIKYMEQARCALLDKLGYNYEDMEASGFSWPIVSLKCKYIRSVHFNQTILVRATLLEYENRIRIGYVMSDPATGQKLNKSESVQMAVDMRSGESLLESPACLLDAVARAQKAMALIDKSNEER